MVSDKDAGTLSCMELLDKAVREMSRRVTGIEMVREDVQVKQHSGWDSFFIKTSGDYNAAIVMSAESTVFYGIACSMKKNKDISEKDIEIYVTEYFNIVCGFFISRLNNAKKLKARFRIPEFRKGSQTGDIPADSLDGILQYHCTYGKIQFCGTGLPQ